MICLADDSGIEIDLLGKAPEYTLQDGLVKKEILH